MKIQKRYRAFTLNEIIMVMAIISILSLVGFLALRGARSVSQFKAAQREVASTIKLAQSYALQGKLQADPAGSGLISPCGYGFHFKNETEYEIFYNLPDEADPALKCAGKNVLAEYRRWRDEASGKSVSAESFSLKNGVELISAPDSVEIYFTLPHANIFDTDGAPFINTYPSGSPLEMEFLSGTATKSVYLDSGGFVTE